MSIIFSTDVYIFQSSNPSWACFVHAVVGGRYAVVIPFFFGSIDYLWGSCSSFTLTVPFQANIFSSKWLKYEYEIVVVRNLWICTDIFAVLQSMFCKVCTRNFLPKNSSETFYVTCFVYMFYIRDFTSPGFIVTHWFAIFRRLQLFRGCGGIIKNIRAGYLARAFHRSLLESHLQFCFVISIVWYLFMLQIYLEFFSLDLINRHSNATRSHSFDENSCCLLYSLGTKMASLLKWASTVPNCQKKYI